MRRSRIGLFCSAVAVTVVGGLPPTAAMAQPTPTPTPTTTSTEPSASPSESNGSEMLSGVLHGEGIVQTTKGPVRVAMQNGAATTLSPTSVTVRSSDGYTQTWTLAKNLKVYDKRHTLQPGALKAGARMVVAGTTTNQAGGASPGGTASPNGATYTATLVFVSSS